MDSAQGPTQDFFPQTLRGTHTKPANSSGRPHAAAELRVDGPAAWHVPTGTEDVKRGMGMRMADCYCSLAPEVRISPLKRIPIPRFTSSVLGRKMPNSRTIDAELRVDGPAVWHLPTEH